MRKQYYECHVTIEELLQNKDLKQLVESLGWKYSVIAGDIVLGPGPKHYATKHFNKKIPQQLILDELHGTADDLIKKGFKVVRRKCELVIFDDKKSGEPCNGACPECHLDDLTQ